MKLKSGQKLPRASATHAGLLLTLAGSQVLAQEADEAKSDVQKDTDVQEEVVVLGTRRTDRSVTDSASPVDIIGAAELATQPAADMLEVLKNVVPSFNVAQNQISDASTFVRAPSLRGLAGDMTLVMINGKRLNRAALVQVAADDPTNALSQGADLAVLPTIAFGSLQILREGATAQYGTDAIAGVHELLAQKRRRLRGEHPLWPVFRRWRRRRGQADCSLSRDEPGRAAASSPSPLNTTMMTAPSATRRVLQPSCSRRRIRIWPTSCPTTRTRSRSTATRRQMAGRPWSTPPMT